MQKGNKCIEMFEGKGMGCKKIITEENICGSNTVSLRLWYCSIWVGSYITVKKVRCSPGTGTENMLSFQNITSVSYTGRNGGTATRVKKKAANY